MTELLKISLPDGSVREMEPGSTPADVAAAIGLGLAKAALAARVNGELRDLNRPFEGDAELALVTSRDEEDALELARHDYAHVLAHYLGSMSKEPPPGGVENWPHITEVVAVFMGFGLMMANSAHTVSIRSCGSCAGPAVERGNALSQYDITYALAIFSCLKGIPTREVLVNLKKTLRPFYKKAAKEVMRKSEELDRVRGNQGFSFQT